MATIADRQIIERTAYWILPLTGRTISRCLVDTAFSMEIREDSDEFLIRIESNFRLRNGDPELSLSCQRPRDLGPALDVLRRTVISARAYKAGMLELVFSHGAHLVVDPDEEYEAWEFAGPHGMRVVCAPGGSLSIWQADGVTGPIDVIH